MVDYGKTLTGGMRFAVQPKRWLPFFVLDSIFMTAFVAYVVANASLFMQILSPSAADSLTIFSSIMGLAGFSIILFLAWILIRIYIGGAIIHQSVKPKETKQSWTVARERYLTILAVAAIVSIASAVVGAVPYVGWLASIIISLLFFFSMPPTIIGKKKFDDAIRISIDLFREKMADVLLAWVLISIVSMIIVFVFMIPALAVTVGILLPYLVAHKAEADGTQILGMILQNGWSLYPAMLVALLGLAIGNVFALFVQTNIYVQLTRKKLLG